LFLYRLLEREDGRASLRRFLELLPSHANWQLSFLEAYQFAQLRDVEKWWGLTRMEHPGLNAVRWSADQSEQHIREILDVPVQVRSSRDALPSAGKTTLQEIILKWDPATQTNALQKVVGDLVALRPKVTPEFVPVVDRYTRIVEGFLRENSPATLAWMRMDSAPRRSREAAAGQLAEADKQLTELRLRLAAAANVSKEK
jgi:hypothetical protein